MADLPQMPLWTGAYLSDTTHLSTFEHGVYLLLLMTMWRNGGVLPDDDKLLAKFAHITIDRWRRVRPVIMEFMKATEGGFTQARLEKEWSLAQGRLNRSKRAANARWLGNKAKGDAQASPEHMPEADRGNATTSTSTSTSTTPPPSKESEEDARTRASPPPQDKNLGDLDPDLPPPAGNGEDKQEAKADFDLDAMIKIAAAEDLENMEAATRRRRR